MASEDVIELGSSDDEAGPPPKKAEKPQKPVTVSNAVPKLVPLKPRPNAMVCIPNKLPDITIKPSKPYSVTITKNSGTATKKGTPCKTLGKVISKTKVQNAHIIATKQNGKSFSRQDKKGNIGVVQRLGNTAINPYGLMKNLNNTQFKMKIFPSASNIINPIRIQQPRTLNNLPPSITVKRMQGGSKRAAPSTVSNTWKKLKINSQQQSPATVVTVELTDDEPAGPSTAGPQWYLRPEDQKQEVKENESNKEPETPNFIEITIEDSPIKAKNKRTYEVGSELPITIDDSPVKPHAAKEPSVTYSDDDDEIKNDKVPNSKKKLEYPHDKAKTIEIEIEPFATEFTKVDNAQETDVQTNQEKQSVVKMVEPPAPGKSNEAEKEQNQTPTAMKSTTEQNSQLEETATNNEFHPVYQSFIDLCLKLENTEDMKKIVEKKIQGYYRQVPKEYTESEEFIDMVSSKILAIKAGPEKMYLYIKDVVDELNLQRKMAKSQVVLKDTKSEEPEKFQFGDDSEFDSKRQRQIRKLEKTLKKLHRAIQKLEEQEVDFDDDEDSVYLLTERYKERLVRVHAKFCQLTNTKLPSEPRILIEPRSGQPSGPAKRLEKWVNKKVSIGTLLPFPDFHDVLRCVREANQEDKLGWNEADIMEEARDLFTRCGKKLQRRRQENEWRVAASRLTLEVDPADENEDLKKKLDQNGQIACKRETELFNKYADRQSLLMLEPVEIGDKEADESPIESEEETVEESSNLEDKEKRKERIKRLIQEKSKKVVEENDGKSQQSSDDVEITDINNESSVKMPEETEKEVEADTVEKYPLKEEDIIQTVDEDDDDFQSDVDELHLLQQLHSGDKGNSSTSEISDSDSPIDISDTLQSSSEHKGAEASDVISIEDSSYSETEVDKESTDLKSETEVVVNQDSLEKDVGSKTDTKCLRKDILEYDAGTKKETKHSSKDNLERDADSKTEIKCTATRHLENDSDSRTDIKSSSEEELEKGADTKMDTNRKDNLKEDAYSKVDNEFSIKEIIEDSKLDTNCTSKNTLEKEVVSKADTECSSKEDLEDDVGSKTDANCSSKENLEDIAGSKTETNCSSNENLEDDAGSKTNTNCSSKENLEDDADSKTNTNYSGKENLKNDAGSKSDTYGSSKENLEKDDDSKAESSPTTSPKVIHSKNDEYAGPVEDILLASSDDEADEGNTENPEIESCINLKDDSISIGDTIIEGTNCNVDKLSPLVVQNDSQPSFCSLIG